MSIALKFLGPFQVTVDDQPVAFATNIARALLAYLAVEADRPHSREVLSALLWPDYPQATAFTNLRTTLARLRRAVPDSIEVLRVTVQTLQFTNTIAKSDVTEFEDRLLECAVHGHTDILSCPQCIERLQQATVLYRGEFLSGLSLNHSQPFEEWMLLKREQLHRQVIDTLHTLARHHEAQGDYEAMRQSAARQLELEPWREQAHAQMMRALAGKGDRTAALAQYETCRRILNAELGVDPNEEIRTLWERIRTDGRGRPGVAGVKKQSRARHAAPQTGRVFGREREMAALSQWLVHDQCKLVAVLGMGGLGKTTLAASIAHAVAPQFEVVIWQTLSNAPPLAGILRAILQTLSEHSLSELPARLDEQLTLLMDYLRQKRCLIVLDNLESILQTEPEGMFRQGYESYGQLLRRMAEDAHQSCLLFTSREQPRETARLGDDRLRKVMWLTGLASADGQTMLATQGLSGQSAHALTLVQRYSGNPLALKLVAQTIQELFVGDIREFLATDALIFDDIRTVLDEQFGRLSKLERELLFWLAIEREPVTMPDLRANLIQPETPRAFVEALRALQRRSWLEVVSPASDHNHANGNHINGYLQSELGAAFTLQNVIMEYITGRLVDEACHEIEHERPHDLHHYALLKAQAKDYVRQSQTRLILQPVITRLTATLGEAILIEKLQHMLATLPRADALMPSYLAGNILNLLLGLRADVRGWDFSGLSVWQAYLRGTMLTNVNFAGADLRGCAFTDAFHAVNAVAYSPDGQRLVAATNAGTIRLWRISDWQSVGLLTGHSGGVGSIAFSADGRWLASGSNDQTVRIWDADSGRIVHILRAHSHLVKSVAFSPDGTKLASGSRDNRVRVWDVRTGQLLLDLQGHTRTVACVAFSPDGKMLASGSWDRTVRIWDSVTGQAQHILREHERGVACLAFSPDEATLATGSWDRAIRVWDIANERVRHELHGHSRAIQCITFSPNGALLASGGEEGIVRLWDARNGRALHVLSGHISWVASVAFNPDGETLVSASWDQTMRVWDVQTGHDLHTLHGFTSQVRAVAFSPNGALLLCGGEDATLRLWDTQTGKLLHAIHGHTDTVSDVACGPDGMTFASSSWDGTVRIWSLHDYQVQYILRGHTDDINALTYSPDGRLLASFGDDHTVRVWEVQTGRCVHVLEGHPDAVICAAFSPDSHLLASCGSNQMVCVWDVEKGSVLQTIPGSHADVSVVTAIMFDPNGCVLLGGSQGYDAQVWDLNVSQAARTFQGHIDRVTTLAFGPQGRWLASGGNDHTVRVWDMGSGQLLHVLQGHTSILTALAFSSDGALIASAGYDETIRLWDTQSGQHLRVLRAEGPYAGMKITGVTGLTEAQKTSLEILGALADSVPTVVAVLEIRDNSQHSKMRG